AGRSGEVLGMDALQRDSDPKVPAAKLPALGIDARNVTMSGISAGAYVAVQMHVAYSTVVSGVGTIAGGVYGCAEGNVDRALDICMKIPAQVEPAKYIEVAKRSAEEGKIDPLENLARGRIFILNGARDSIVNPASGEQLKTFYSSFLPTRQIQTKFDLQSAHGHPTLSYGNGCTDERLPWLNNCKYDASGAILGHTAGTPDAAVPSAAGSVSAFDQKEFGSAQAVMADSGSVYIPAACKKKSANCRLHIALHGCMQSPSMVGDKYVRFAGYNEWAEANKMVVLYPAVGTNRDNPYGCWDWWGYTGPEYATREGKQLKAFKAMIDRLASKP
ncbi:MAG: hypothetical protein NDJ90_15580, partial [Oligoflexia bacterium]|nr:hypothetical protein [Oligoflexia bacterium]